VDRFRYQATDGTASSNEATVSITVVGVNDPPKAVNDTYTVVEDTQLTVGLTNRILLNDTDAESDPLTAVRISGPSNGTLNLNSNGTFTYTPAPNFSGVDTFVYRANDGATNSNTATVTINVTGINHPPNAGTDAYSTQQGTQLNVTAANGVLRNDTDVDQTTPLTAQLATQPTNGTVNLSSNGAFVYTPRSGFSGTDRFTYRAVDNGGLMSAPTTVTITVASATVFQNPTNSRDVNNDGAVSPLDALLIINHLNNVGSHPLTSAISGIPFPDPNGDNNISPADVLVVVNQLNSSGNGEGEASVQFLSANPALQSLPTGVAIQPLTSDVAERFAAIANEDQLASDRAEEQDIDFFTDLGRSDFARQYQAMSASARATLAAKAKDLESVLDSLFDGDDLEDAWKD